MASWSVGRQISEKNVVGCGDAGIESDSFCPLSTVRGCDYSRVSQALNCCYLLPGFSLRPRQVRCHNAATTIQSTVRSAMARRMFHRQVCAATTIQSTVRSAMARRMFHRQVCAATTIQSTVRSAMARRMFHRQVCAATTIHWEWGCLGQICNRKRVQGGIEHSSWSTLHTGHRQCWY